MGLVGWRPGGAAGRRRHESAPRSAQRAGRRRVPMVGFSSARAAPAPSSASGSMRQCRFLPARCRSRSAVARDANGSLWVSQARGRAGGGHRAPMASVRSVRRYRPGRRPRRQRRHRPGRRRRRPPARRDRRHTARPRPPSSTTRRSVAPTAATCHSRSARSRRIRTAGSSSVATATVDPLVATRVPHAADRSGCYRRSHSSAMGALVLLDGKVAIVSGAGAGLGRSICVRFASHGARVMIGDLDEQAVSDSIAAVQSVGGQASGRVTDITSRADCDALVQLRARRVRGARHARQRRVSRRRLRDLRWRRPRCLAGDQRRQRLRHPQHDASRARPRSPRRARAAW